jgi:hypothetical protein
MKNTPKLLTLLCSALLVTGSAVAGEARTVQPTDQAQAAFQRLLDHTPVDTAPRSAPAADPLLEQLLAAFGAVHERQAAAATVQASAPYDAARASFERLLADDADRAPRPFVAEPTADPLVEHLSTALHARRGAAGPY